MNVLSAWGWLFIPLGLFGSIIGCFLLGILMPFEDEEQRQDWLWGCVFAGIVSSILWITVR